MSENLFKDSKYMKRSKMFWIIPSIILGVILVSALTYIAYTHSFTKLISVVNNGGSGDTNVQISGSGDILDTTIICDRITNECIAESGIITLTNSDNIAHNCIVTTTGDIKVDVKYDKEVNPIVIPARSSNNFKIIYTSSVIGEYPMLTHIECASEN